MESELRQTIKESTARLAKLTARLAYLEAATAPEQAECMLGHLYDDSVGATCPLCPTAKRPCEDEVRAFVAKYAYRLLWINFSNPGLQNLIGVREVCTLQLCCADHGESRMSCTLHEFLTGDLPYCTGHGYAHPVNGWWPMN